ncbi:tetratricopeptide repeat protein [Halodesulfovibrio marinisediminis]|uniref:Flp pilus assembly protein TadD, contains TPR repeats n=1 Tax=Halodesulfovibrio marinisediminis DSM 17456 TaxID=1121457 RepID=A0A1N6E3A9_9BACT|nr:tetratricopeptide repeat protein [Halodesulfovibrio marinisediminis]SIN77535.1 Flp pilus assembly protein TadD, contains TPR repeats [Halodesulfovibrio marinisediminis DSM 17456]
MRTNNKRFRSVIMFCCALLLVSGCAANMPEPQTATSQVLNADAATTYHYLLFEEAARNNDYRKAEDALAKLLTLSPPPELYVEAVTFHLRNNRIITGRKVAIQGTKAFPDNFRLVLLKAESYRLEDKLERAVEVLRDYLEKHPKSDDAFRAIGLLYFDSGKFPEAVDAFRESDEKKRSPITRLYLAKALIQLKKYDDAEKELLSATEQKNNILETWSELARLYELKQDYVLAEQAYEQLITADTSNEISWLRLINLNLKLNNPAKAVELVEIGPASDEFTLEAATIFISEGFYKEAKTMLEPFAEAKRPVEVFFHLALIAFEYEKNLPKALELLNNIPQGNPTWTKSLEFRSRLMYELGKTDEAIALVQSARERDPRSRFILELETELLMAAKRPKDALKTINSALKTWPDDQELLFTKGSIYHSIGEKKLALETMEQIISNDPEYFKALNFVGYTLAEMGKDLDRALVLVRTAATLAPGQPYILDSLAWVYFLRNDYKNAWTYITQAVTLGTNDPTIWEHYGDIAKQRGNIVEAQKGYENALRQHSNPALIKQKLKDL